MNFNASLRGGVIMTAVALLATGVPGAYAQPPSSSPAVSNAAPVDAAVELSANQLSAIKIEPVKNFLFPVEKEAPGSVGFDRDPAEIQAESTLLAAAGTAQVASNELVRAKALYETNGVAQRELEQAVSDDETAEAALRSAQYAVLALGVKGEEIDQMLAAGRIDAKPAMNAKWVLADVMESDSPSLRVDQPVKVRLTAFPDRTFNGKVSRIYTTVDPNLHRQPIRCEVEDPENELHVGMLANVTIQVSDPVESLALPLNGVVREGDGTMTAWVTADRKHFTQKIIKTGLREDGKVQVLDGLQAGQLAVTDGAIFLDNMINAVPSD